MGVHEAPHAPWALRGEVVLGLVGGGRAPDRSCSWAGGLPDGVRALPGPVAVAAVRYTASPIGSFLELAVAVPARLGLRPGFCDVLMVVSEPAAKVGLRCNWGFPADVGTLTWAVDGDERVVRWEERGLELRCSPAGPTVPFVLPARAVQRRGDGPVVVPRRVAALARVGRVEVGVPADDELHWLSGSHLGAVVSGMRLVMRPARHPQGLLSTFRAPLRAAEPGLSYRGKGATPARPSAAAEALQ